MIPDILARIQSDAEAICGFYPDAQSFGVYMRQNVKDMLGINEIILSDGRHLPVIIDDNLLEREDNGNFSSDIFIASPELLNDLHPDHV